MQNEGVRIGDRYTVQRGVMTSANDIFLVQSIAPTATKGVMTITNEGKEQGNIEEELLRPLVRGEDISTWNFKVSGYIIWTHDDDTGEVKTKIPANSFDYFSKYERRLLKRDDYKKGQPIWTIFRVSRYKLKSKVAWGELSRTMEVVFVPDVFTDNILGERKLITIQTVYAIAADSEEFSYALAAILNSTPVRSFITSFAERARGRYFRHISWTVGLVPLPKSIAEGNVKDPTVKNLIEFSKSMHKCKGEDPTLAYELDKAVAKLYGLSEDDLNQLREYLSSCGVPIIEQVKK
jgi:hypothetical protein